jgi:hypothetical protein
VKREFDDIDERLREWASYFRDRRSLESCRSIEHRYRPVSEDFAAEGWGDQDAAREPKRTFILLRALATHDAVMQLEKAQKWSVTYAYCYPSLPRGLVLRCMKKWIGKPVSWKVFTEQVEIARYRVAASLLKCSQ